jgi:putative ABC transport system substrate-binding protein
MRRREFITLFGSTAVTWPLSVRAQQSAMPVIGYLSNRSPDGEAPLRTPFLQSLEASGFLVGRNVAIEYRYGDGQEARLPALVAELLRLRVTVLTAFGRQTALAAKAATATVPIVFTTGLDPVMDGLVASLNRPGGNATGVSVFTTELGPKRLALLRELQPKPGTIAFVVDSNNSTTPFQVKEMQAAAQSIGQPLLIAEAGTEDQVDKLFATIAERNIVSILFGASQYFQVVIES